MRRISTALVVSLAAVTVIAAMPGTAEANHRSRRGHSHVGVSLMPKGLYFGGGLTGSRILSQEGGDEILKDGAGLNLYTGLRVSPNLSLELGWTGTAHNPVTVDTNFGTDTDYLVMNGFTADAKIYLGQATAGSRIYGQGGVGLYLLDSDYFGAQAVGSGFQAGGGIEFAVGRNVDLGVRALYRGISMGPPEGGEADTFISAVTADANLTLRY